MKRIVLLTATASLAAAISIFAGGLGASAAPALPTITLAMNGKSITVGGTLQSGAVNIVSTVTKEPQANPALFRFNPGASFGQVTAAVRAHHGDLNYAAPYGSFVFSAVANKGVSSVQTTLAPGNYAALDLGGNGQPPHTTFTITEASSPASLPAAQATIQAIDFGFRGPGTLHDGELVRFQNSGFVVHMILAMGVKDAKAAAKATSLLKAGKDNQAGKLATSFVPFDGGTSPGGMHQEVITAKPGVYVLLCFMNSQDGREHTQLGMERTIRIRK